MPVCYLGFSFEDTFFWTCAVAEVCTFDQCPLLLVCGVRWLNCGWWTLRFNPPYPQLYSSRLVPHILLLEKQVARPRDCTMCRECIREPGWNEKVSLSRIADHFIFGIESVGMLPPKVRCPPPPPLSLFPPAFGLSIDPFESTLPRVGNPHERQWMG